MSELDILINALINGEIGLNDNRRSMLNRVPDKDDWAAFQYQIDPDDLIWLTAETGDTFAVLRCSGNDILLHGRADHCRIEGLLLDNIKEHKIRVIAECHPSDITCYVQKSEGYI